MTEDGAKDGEAGFLASFRKDPKDGPAGIDELAKSLAADRETSPPMASEHGDMPGDASFREQFQQTRARPRQGGTLSVRLPADELEVFYRYALEHGITLRAAVMVASNLLAEQLGSKDT